jgi:hypothetical protein
MANVYLEFEDGHNSPTLRTYDDVDAAMADIVGTNKKGSAIYDEAFTALFDDGNDEYWGEWNNGDKWTLITLEVAQARAEYWGCVVAAIIADEKAPF